MILTVNSEAQSTVLSKTTTHSYILNSKHVRSCHLHNSVSQFSLWKSTTVLFFTMLCYTQTKHNITLENMSPTQCFIMGEMMRYSSKCYLPPPPILFSSFNLPPLPICLISQKQNSQEAWPHRRLTTTTAGLFLTVFTNTMLLLNHHSVQKSLATFNQVTGTW